tara:strand:- start:1890 stop:2324 length:435 start_codon:yes stop_codon:yes gene_type:complete
MALLAPVLWVFKGDTEYSPAKIIFNKNRNIKRAFDCFDLKGIVDTFMNQIKGKFDDIANIIKDIFEFFFKIIFDSIKELLIPNFVSFFKPLFAWFIEPIMIFIFGNNEFDGIYDIAIRYMFYGIIVICLGIILEILSISKIWAG